MAITPNESLAEPSTATGPVISGNKLNMIDELAKALNDHLTSHGDVKGEMVDAPIPGIMLKNTACIGPYPDGSWVAIHSSAEHNDVKIYRIPRKAVEK